MLFSLLRSVFSPPTPLKKLKSARSHIDKPDVRVIKTARSKEIKARTFMIYSAIETKTVFISVYRIKQALTKKLQIVDIFLPRFITNPQLSISLRSRGGGGACQIQSAQTNVINCFGTL